VETVRPSAVSIPDLTTYRMHASTLAKFPSPRIYLVMNGHSSFPILQESHKKHCGQLSVISQAKEALNGIGPSLRPCRLSRVKSPHKHDGETSGLLDVAPCMR